MPLLTLPTGPLPTCISAVLGWNGFLAFAILYYMIPKMWDTNLYSKKLATNHFWLGTIGIIIYAVPMYWAGFEQSLMWKHLHQKDN